MKRAYQSSREINDTNVIMIQGLKKTTSITVSSSKKNCLKCEI